MLVALLLQAVAADAFDQGAWGRFSRSPALAHRTERVAIATDGRDDGQQGTLHYKLRLTTTAPERPDTVLWANSRTCPAVRKVVASLRTLAPPRPAPPGFDEPAAILLDGVGYELSVPALDPYGQSRVTWRSNVDTPLAAWVDRSLAALAPCWSPAPPHVR